MKEFISNEEMELFLPEFINIYKNRPIKNFDILKPTSRTRNVLQIHLN